MEKIKGSGLAEPPFLKSSISQDIEISKSKSEFIEAYYKRGLSIIPVRDKRPLISWREYQERQAEPEEIYKWCVDFPNFNIGIITGFNGFYSLDLDTKEAFNLLPKELKNSMLTETQRGFHFNFQSSRHYSSQGININGLKVEFKGAGSYVIEPYSVINGFEYRPINSIADIKNLPALIDDLLQEKQERKIGREVSGKIGSEIKKISWTYNGSANCVKQILDRELREGERETAFFILYNLLLRGKNSREYSEALIIRKNKYLINSLPEKELLALLKQKPYNSLGCAYVRENLPWISCEGCKYYKEVFKKMDFKKALNDPKISKEDLKLIYELYIEEKTNKAQIAEDLQMSRQAIYRRLEKVKKLGYNL